MKVMKCITLVFLVILIFPVSSSLAGHDVIKFSFSQITPAAHPYYSIGKGSGRLRVKRHGWWPCYL